MLVLVLFAPAHLVPLAFDAGSVTTGVVSAPMIIALTGGITSVMARRAPISDGFGLLGLASAGPIVVILVLSLFLR
jgi:hypothetical protein